MTTQPKSLFDGEAEAPRPRPLVRRLADGAVVALFFAVVMLAALPMGANRDWAWAPIALVVGAVSVVMALGLGAGSGFEVAERERRPLLVLIACYGVFMAVAFLQMSSFAPASGSAWLYDSAAKILGRAHAAVPDLAIDAARNVLLKCLACGLIFLAARAVCRDRAQARLLLVLFVASAVLVVTYGLVMHATTHSCYVGAYLKKQGEYLASHDRCLMSGTFVSSNSFACYAGMGLVAALALLFSGGRRREEAPYGYDEDDDEGLIAWLTGSRLALLAVGLYLLGGLLFSASRAGFAASLAGILALGLLLMRGRWRSRPDLGRIFVAGIVIAIVVGVIAGSTLLDKAARGDDGGTRIRIWLATLDAIRMSPWLGWGLGSFSDIYAMVQPARIPQPNDIAHSTPLETVVEVGIPAAIVAFAIVLLPWWICLRGALTRRRAQRYLPAAAFAIAGVAIVHSTVDFSLQIPAIGFVTSAMLGLGWAQAFGRRERSSGAFTPWE